MSLPWLVGLLTKAPIISALFGWTTRIQPPFHQESGVP